MGWMIYIVGALLTFIGLLWWTLNKEEPRTASQWDRHLERQVTWKDKKHSGEQLGGILLFTALWPLAFLSLGAYQAWDVAVKWFDALWREKAAARKAQEKV